jgi:hypothetical protein
MSEPIPADIVATVLFGPDYTVAQHMRVLQALDAVEQDRAAQAEPLMTVPRGTSTITATDLDLRLLALDRAIAARPYVGEAKDVVPVLLPIAKAFEAFLREGTVPAESAPGGEH